MQWRSGNELREMFLAYFEEKGSKRFKSFPLIPEDPSIMFTIAGMVPFKPYFLGIRTPEGPRAVTSQKCLRTNDIDNVGRTARHHTFFEMLGNFSFGDYFKKEAIPFAWEFLTERVGLEPDRMYASIYLDDDEAFDIWHNDVGLSKDRIFRMGEEDNYWSIGPVGPCGPCSELYYDQGEAFSCGKPTCTVGCDCDRYLEVWNLVFMQFNRFEDGRIEPLPKQNIDTGMGLERLAAVVQRAPSDFETDLFKPLIDATCSLAGVRYGAGPKEDRAVKVIADHIRALAFMIADGILPANDGRGYVLRRLLRRAAMLGRLIGLDRPFLVQLMPTLLELMAGHYSELKEHRSTIEQVLQVEESRFNRTLEQGSNLLDTEVARLEERGESVLPGEVAFELYDTFGFPCELTEEICEERGCSLDHEGFRREMEAQRDRARQAGKHATSRVEKTVYTELHKELGDTPFDGYAATEGDAAVQALIADGERVSSASEGQEVEVVLDRTPFYAEGGGQIGDEGVLTGEASRLAVRNTVAPAERLVVHQAVVEAGTIAVGDAVHGAVDAERRQAVRRHHTATHILHEALIQVLGPHVRQSGSLVAPDMLRFDFTHFAPLRREEVLEVERIANREILANTPLAVERTTLDRAKERGAKAIFEEKYGEEVRLVSIHGFSAELCGGTHVDATGDIGSLRIIHEEGIGSGIRRIIAKAGMPALEYAQETSSRLHEIAGLLGGEHHESPEKIVALQEELKELRKELADVRLRRRLEHVDGLIDGAQEVAGIRVVTASFEGASPDVLRQVGDTVKNRLSPVLVVLAAVGDGKVQFIAMADESAREMGLHAGNILREVAKAAGGGGGGKPAMAQAGGKRPEKTDEALALVPELVSHSRSG
ncbi:MAG: alanine--tRNA ligase [Synergistales bacterium]|nr:alanine--tRNA ligase [Synergistales bacterium]